MPRVSITGTEKLVLSAKGIMILNNMGRYKYSCRYDITKKDNAVWAHIAEDHMWGEINAPQYLTKL